MSVTNQLFSTRLSLTALLAAGLLALSGPLLAQSSDEDDDPDERSSGSSRDLGSYSVGAPGSSSRLGRSDREEMKMERPEFDRSSFNMDQGDMALEADYGSSDSELELDIRPSRENNREDRRDRSVEKERQLSQDDLESGELEDQDLRPVRVEAPRYPGRAHRRGIEGYVTVEFVVDTNGRTRNVRVVESEPNDVFDQSARNAVRRWEFEPRIVDGRPAATELRQTIDFTR